MQTYFSKHLLQQLFGLLLVCLPFFSLSQQPEKELADVKQQIALTEQQVKKQKQQLEQAEKKLQQSDKALAQASALLHDTDKERLSLLEEEQKLQTAKTDLESAIKQQQSLLSSQIKSAYTLGQHDYTRLLLNQQDAGKLERVLSYYQYFNQARMKELGELNNNISKLQNVLLALSEKQAELTQMLNKLQLQQQQLLSAKQEQQNAVKRLQTMLSQQGQQLDYLRQNEASLHAKLEEIQKLARQARELNGLSSSKGKLSWPVAGKVLLRFGENRQGGIPSRGILIASEEGKAVKAVADGHVIYADWLKGYGWVIVLDHGAGFMSLYGHNQSLLQKPGNRVSAGENIALAGMSGGQSTPGLYFEIRSKGDAVDPLAWLFKK